MENKERLEYSRPTNEENIVPNAMSKLQGELIVWNSSERLSYHVSEKSHEPLRDHDLEKVEWGNGVWNLSRKIDTFAVLMELGEIPFE